MNVVNKAAGEGDHLIAAAGGIPGEVAKGWRVKQRNTFDLEFGFSCMGYEVAGGWGNAMATAGSSTPIVMVGDGSYLMLNAELYSSVLTGHKMIVVICDNGGYAVINRLQEFKGTPGFNNLFKDCRRATTGDPPLVDFAQHAGSMGAHTRHCESLADLEAALEWAKGTDRTTVLSIATEAYTWTPGDAAWDVGVPEVSERETVRAARADHEEIRAKQRVGSVRDAGSEAGHRAHRLVERRPG